MQSQENLIQDQLQRKQEELQKTIVKQQEELKKITKQLLMARCGILPTFMDVCNIGLQFYLILSCIQTIKLCLGFFTNIHTDFRANNSTRDLYQSNNLFQYQW